MGLPPPVARRLAEQTRRRLGRARRRIARRARRAAPPCHVARRHDRSGDRRARDARGPGRLRRCSARRARQVRGARQACGARPIHFAAAAMSYLSYLDADRHEPLAHLSVAGRPRPALPRAAGALVRDAQAPEARADRRRADRDGRRQRRPLRGLSRPAQPVARPGQGRRALPPRRDARGGDGAVGLDDGQVRRGEPALRRRQGRHPRRSEAAVAEGARAHDAPLHQRDRHHHRPAAATSPRPT